MTNIKEFMAKNCFGKSLISKELVELEPSTNLENVWEVKVFQDKSLNAKITLVGTATY